VDPALPGLETDRTLGPGADAEGVRASGAGAGVGAVAGAAATAFGTVLAASTRDVRPFAGGFRGGADISDCARLEYNSTGMMELNQLLNFCFRGSTHSLNSDILCIDCILWTTLTSSRRPIHTTMPRPNDSPDVATSKTLAYILRHGAEKESLHIRTDGYIKLDDVVSPLAQL
jgi:hypothetical protein